MKPTLLTLILSGAVFILAAEEKQSTNFGDQSDLRIYELQSEFFGIPDMHAPFRKEGNKPAFTVHPQFEINHPEADEMAKGWIIASEKGIHIRVLVMDASHTNTYENQNLYMGDAVQIGLDGRGDGTRGNDATLEGAFGDDDIAFTLAIGSNGSQGWIHFKGDRQVNDPVPEENISITRNDKKGQTDYHLFVEWDKLGVIPGLYPDIGIAVMINDSEPDVQRQVRYSYGEGAGGRMKPGLFKRVRIDGITGSFVASESLNAVYWDAAHPVRYLVSTQGESLNIDASYEGIKMQSVISGKEEIQRYMVELHPDANIKGSNKLIIGLTGESGKIITTDSIRLIIPDNTVDNFLSCIDELLKDSPHELFTRHLVSLKSITQVEWGRVKLILANNTRHAEESLGFITSMLKGMSGPAGRWENYRESKLSMIVAYVSRRDRTVQYYTLTLPKNWDPDKEYPLFVELHGAGNQNPLSGPAARLGFEEGTPPLLGYSSVRGYAASQGSGYHIEPFGRGNTGYRDIGAIDVWEAFDDVSTLFRIDENRRYLFGFSMGGGGTAYLGMRTPHLWAAIGIYSGAYRESSGAPLGMNVSYLPVWMWCGEEDFLYNNMKSLEKEIREYGNEPKVTWVPNLGHNYRGDGQEAGVNWMQQFTRKRPEKFSFVAVDNDYAGTWGINMERDINVSGTPSFTCSIKDNEINIISEGAPEITIEMGETGLQLTGDVVLTWNGNEVYRGESCNFLLSEDGCRELKRLPQRRGSLVRSILSNY